ncbi:TIR domain-containing protein [Ferrovibrio xuzhouensis]|uniref:TIR domain-containing protein n=1 Tax=Ferrovibrio xuzhouensis TaxID=1576914 RepID=A0ABV7VLD5_9PROT
MPKKLFYSFHFDRDVWRTSQVRNIGSVEGREPVNQNKWEEVKRGGDAAIQRWIDAQMADRDCLVVLIGAETASRPWITYEIKKAWANRIGVFGIRIHKLLDAAGNPCVAGPSPFSDIIAVYDPPGPRSTDAYAHIAQNIAGWVDTAIQHRKRYN